MSGWWDVLDSIENALDWIDRRPQRVTTAGGSDQTIARSSEAMRVRA
jgi:hypothetical protein